MALPPDTPATPAPGPRRSPLGPILVIGVLGVGTWSWIGATDRLTWWLESCWVIVGLPLAVIVARRRGITPLLQLLLAAHAVLLLVGAHYTYERVPLGDWWREWFGFARNHYDRLGHLMQGFAPAILIRELLRRTSPLGPGGWTPVLVTCCALAFSAVFEMIEWASSVALGHGADAFLGSQGDPWDAQWDMLCCLIGATASLAVFTVATTLHERQLARLPHAVRAPQTTH
jgi:putative membrane protein